MSLIDQLYLGGVWTDSDVRASNTSGTAVLSAVLAGTGEELADDYTLVVSGRAGGTGTVTISTSANNPFNGKVVTGLNFDGTTIYDTVIPGVNLVFDSSGANANTSIISVGYAYGSFDASGVGAGVPTAGVKHRVHNDGTSDVNEAVATLLTQSIQVKITGLALDRVGPFADGATEKTAGGGSDRVMPYALTISGISGSGGAKVATLAIDGVTFGADTLLDLSAGTTSDGVGLKAIGSGNPYRVVDGPLTGLEFSIDPACANSDKANIMIFPSRYVQIAQDISGVEGTYGTSDVILTETGEASGVITAGGVADYWVRFLVPSSANNESNPYPCDIALSASLSTSAGWEA